ncbi:MAG: HK97 gp10 family phage protein [Streptosporangiales bacterium]
MTVGGRGEVAELVRDLDDIPPELRRLLRPKLRAAAQPIVARARRKASWSTRIPSAIKVQTSFSGRHPGVFIRVDATKAPHARPFENLGKPGTFRHPVFGDREVWVNQKARPFLFPAVEAAGPHVREVVSDAISDAARLHGFRPSA